MGEQATIQENNRLAATNQPPLSWMGKRKRKGWFVSGFELGTLKLA